MLDVLGHTYLTSQGAKHNDIEQIAGYASPSTLALYRNVKQQKKSLALDQITVYIKFN
jgi:hypothetical protein